MAAYSILIVEDHPDLGRMLSTGLKSLGQDFEIVRVPSGEEALLVANSQPIDLLMADYLLPGMNGQELISKLKARQPSIKSILITGSESQQVRNTVANAGADAYFFKPVAFADLLAAVRKSLLQIPAGGPAEAASGAAPEPALELEADETGEEVEEESDDTISEHLSEVRQALDALSVALVDDRGQSLIQAGEMPENLNEVALIPALMAALSAGGKVSHTLGRRLPENLFAFAGVAFDVYMTPVGPSYAVLVVTTHESSAEDRSAAIPVILDGVQELPALLERMGVSMETEAAPPVEAVPEPEEEEEQSAEEIDALFELGATIVLSKEEVDDFWAVSDQGMDTGSLSADDLSYDQARKLGFTPEDTPAEE